jgi:diacylglycerol kinase family enzyme
MLLVVNPRASSYSHGDERAVTRELASAFEVETARTETPGHGTELAAAAARAGGVDAIAVLGGDGAVNEVANGLAGTGVPLAPLPGGRTNVFCRILGLPTDPGRAAHALSDLRPAAPTDESAFPTREIDLGTMNGRHFTFGSGIGLSAVANRRLNAHGVPGQRLGSAVFAVEAFVVLARYLRNPPRMEIEVGDHRFEAMSAVVQNADPLTYLGRRPIPLCAGSGLRTASISLAALRRASVANVVPIGLRIGAGQGASVLSRPEVESFAQTSAARVRTLDGRPLPVEVDGDYVGEHGLIEYGVAPRALSVVWTGGVRRSLAEAPVAAARR